MKKFKLEKKQIPNILTIFRILLVPVIIVLMLVQFGPTIYTFDISHDHNSLFAPHVTINLNILLSAIFFIIASLTDAVDGYVARKMHWVSDFGKFWDPLADKILTNSVLFCLASPQLNIVPIWIPIILLIRDIIVDGTRMMSAKQNLVVPANWWGKVKTINIMVAIIVAFFIGNNYGNVTTAYYWAAQNILMYTSAALSVISGIIYYTKFIKIYNKSKQQLQEANK
ncbi:CDP-diacylglycerol--glycerol-3-phosphate 3-phosphatidyltransferase [Ureaplasma ceti]|uniref:CDP-diacylglycerol--glycerol-3-phosphate 3-phosphatidyltransferase n=1 Tax=Ureaplasma ceti TaxID=3119530 RepID=A0ABP9U7M1_9BACT